MTRKAFKEELEKHYSSFTQQEESKINGFDILIKEDDNLEYTSAVRFHSFADTMIITLGGYTMSTDIIYDMESDDTLDIALDRIEERFGSYEDIKIRKYVGEL